MPIDYHKIDMATFASNSINRASIYLITNGTIHVTLCGLFATTIGVLIALAEQGVGVTRGHVYDVVIPVFSLVILTVSLNISTWVAEQITYLEWFGRERTAGQFLCYEEFKEKIRDNWAARRRGKRYLDLVLDAAAFYLAIPVRMNNVYCYYFLLYAATPIVGLAYHNGTSATWPAIPALVAVQVALVAIGLRGYLVLNRVRDDLYRELFPVAQAVGTGGENEDKV